MKKQIKKNWIPNKLFENWWHKFRFCWKNGILDYALKNIDGSKYRQANRFSKRLSAEVNRLICPENCNFLIRKVSDYRNHDKLNSNLLKVVIFDE